MVDRVNARRLADYIEQQPDDVFDMSYYVCMPEEVTGAFTTFEGVARVVKSGGYPCGTTACIAGHALLGFTDEVLTARPTSAIRGAFCGPYGQQASAFLDLEPYDAMLLFMRFDATKEQAIATLRRLADTGRVEWLP